MTPDSSQTCGPPRIEPGEASPWRLWRAVPLVVATVASVLAAGMLSFMQGTPMVFALVVILVLLVARLEVGIYVLLAAAMVLEQFQIFGIDSPLTGQIPFYANLNSVTGIGPLVVNPVEVVLVGMVGIWALRAASTREWHLRPIPHLDVAIPFLGVLLFYTFYGLARGGDLKAALWEIRALYYLCAAYFLATQLIRTRRHISICLWIIIIGISIKGLQGCWRFFVELGGDIGGAPAITSHEDALFMVTAFVLMSSLFLQGCWKRSESIVLACAFPTTFLTFILTQRRIAYGVLVLSLLIVFALLSRARKKLALKLALPLLPLLLLYTAVFWNSSSTAALPIRQTRSIFEEGEKEDTSNTYRKIENFNLEQTIRQNPLGLGFGKRYLMLIPLPKVDFPLWDYIPHNCIYWMWAKTGFAGFIIFWLFFATVAVQTIVDYRHEDNPFYRAVCLMVVTFIIGQLAVAYYDLQITFYRNMIYLGIAMALPVAIRNLPRAHGPPLCPSEERNDEESFRSSSSGPA